MLVTIIEENIGSVSTISSDTIYKKTVLVKYELAYNSNSYFVDVIVTFFERDLSNRRNLIKLKIDNHEIQTEDEISSIEEVLFMAISDGLVVRFPSLEDIEINEIAKELAGGLLKRLNSFNISTKKIKVN